MITQKIAVIGSGISGLGSAFILSEKHKVYLFEKDKKFGGHSNTITINKAQFFIDWPTLCNVKCEGHKINSNV